MFPTNLLAIKTGTGKALFPLSVLIISLALGCAAPERSFKKGDLTLMLRHKTTSAAELENIDLAHPHKISRQDIARQLRSLAYTHNAILSKGRRVFTLEEAKENSGILVKALRKATPDKIIYMEFDSEEGTTEVELFVSDDKLNWKFYSIHGARYSKNMLKGWGSTWRLIPQKGQALFTSQKLLGTKTWDNWVVAELELPGQKKRKVSGKTGGKKPSKKRRIKKSKAAPAEIDPELEKKLKFLKQLKKKGLIEDDEYKQKRKELLDKYL